MQGSKDRVWEVYNSAGEYAQTVNATSARDAIAQAKERVEANSHWPHREGCTCERLMEKCTKGVLESRMTGTPLGRLCGL